MTVVTTTPVTTTPVPTGTVRCGKEGELMCFGEGYFGICSFGEATVQEVAPGTKCVGGRIVGVGEMERGKGRWGGRWWGGAVIPADGGEGSMGGTENDEMI